MHIVLSNMAWVRKDEIGLEKMKVLKDRLTFMPRASDFDEEPPTPIVMCRDEGEWFGIPRGYFMIANTGGHTIEYKMCDGKPILCDFKGDLREDQKRAMESFHRRNDDGPFYGGLFVIPCGLGKTVLAINLIGVLKKKTIVIVHKEFLVNQWRERIREFMPDARIGLIQQDVCDYKDKDIVIAMVHSLVGERKYPKEVYTQEFGLLICDETHRMGAASFSKGAPLFNAKYRIGLTATFRRKDNMEDVIRYTMGDVFFDSEAKEMMKARVKRVRTGFSLFKNDGFNPNKVPLARLVNMLCRNSRRNAIIVDFICQAREKGRKILVLSDRLDHLDVLSCSVKEELRKKGVPANIDFYVGGRSERELAIASKSDIIMATVHMAAEGLDIKELDSLFLVTPRTDVEQSAGRILRGLEGKKQPIIVDFLDDGPPILVRMYEKREKLYRKKEWLW